MTVAVQTPITYNSKLSPLINIINKQQQAAMTDIQDQATSLYILTAIKALSFSTNMSIFDVNSVCSGAATKHKSYGMAKATSRN